MCPVFAGYNEADVLDRRSEKPCKIGQCFTMLVLCSDLTNLIFGEFGHWVFLSSMMRWCNSAIFGLHVGYVFKLGSKPKMSGLTASGIIAGVQNAQAQGACAIGKLPGDTMGFLGLLGVVKSSVPTIIQSRCPGPAIIRSALIDTRPESLSAITSFAWPVSLKVVPAIFALPGKRSGWISTTALAQMGLFLRGVGSSIGHVSLLIGLAVQRDAPTSPLRLFI